METQSTIKSNGRLNRTAIKRHALQVSQQTRNGKFTRVSGTFIDDVEAIVETLIRHVPGNEVNSPFGQVDTSERFLTGAGEKRLVEMFNQLIGRTIHRQVNQVRVGKTL